MNKNPKIHRKLKHTAGNRLKNTGLSAVKNYPASVMNQTVRVI